MKIHLDAEDILVIHTFAVHPAYLKKGIGKKIMDFIIEHSKAMNIKAIRLDVYEKINLLSASIENMILRILIQLI